jgi:hypothetical protein
MSELGYFGMQGICVGFRGIICIVMGSKVRSNNNDPIADLKALVTYNNKQLIGNWSPCAQF